jgi:hypothetical protein
MREILFGVGIAAVFGFLAFAVKDMPQWISWPGVALGICLTIWGIVPEGKIAPIPVAAAILGVICLVFAAAWHRANIEAGDEAEINRNVSVECLYEMLPKVFGPYERVNVLQLFPLPIENGGGGLMEMFDRSGKEWKFPDDGQGFPMLQGYQCSISNYGTVPLFDFKISLDLTFLKADKLPDQPNTRREGSVTLQRAWDIHIPKLDGGVGKAFVFYMYNNNEDNFVRVLIPKTATATPLGRTKPISLELTVPTVGGTQPLTLAPRFVNTQK